MSIDGLAGKDKKKLLEILNGSKKYEPKRGRPPLEDKEPTVRIGFTLPESLDIRFKELAEAMGMNRSELFRQCIEKFIAHYSEKMKLEKYW